jgi:hypothetical protein
MTWPGPTAVILSLAIAAPPGEWSEDGSAEAALLRKRVEEHDAARAERELGTRGLVLVTDPAASTVTPQPGQPPGTDVPPPRDDTPGVQVDQLTRQAEIERIVRGGRRLFIPGIVLATIGTIFTIGAIAGIAKEANAATGGLLGGSLAVSAIGWPMAVVGIRRRRHPEKFLGRGVALGPGGFTLRF